MQRTSVIKGANPVSVCPLRPVRVQSSRALPRLPAPSPPPARAAVAAAASKGFGPPPPVKPKVKSPPSEAGPPADPCSCQSGKSYKKCCQPAHTGSTAAALPEAALRARFSAFTLGQEKFIADTTHPDYLAFHYDKKSADEAKEQYAVDIHGACTNFDYEELKIDRNEPGASEDEAFIAFTYRSAPKQAEGAEAEREWKTTNEKARFVRINNVWMFADYQRFEYNMNSLMQGAVQPEPIQKPE